MAILEARIQKMKGISSVKLGKMKTDSPTLGTKVKPGDFTVGNPPAKPFLAQAEEKPRDSMSFALGVTEKIKGIGSAEPECIAKDQTECIVKRAYVNGNSEGAKGEKTTKMKKAKLRNTCQKMLNLFSFAEPTGLLTLF
ncbi:hypothetical protein U1Q18_007670, partial [Sarracenia purpurea var. burkii]